MSFINLPNPIIVPNTLNPSTYSQMGTVLIPSRTCNNHVIARKYSEPVAKYRLVNGLKVVDRPFISTFKKFDRPSVNVSRNCQNCDIISVPTVTDKTIYPCTLNKYSVSGQSKPKSKIGIFGNSSYHRITTSNNQLYQQYRINNVNIEQEDECPCELSPGVYNQENGNLGLFVFGEACNQCIRYGPELFQMVLLDWDENCIVDNVPTLGQIVRLSSTQVEISLGPTIVNLAPQLAPFIVTSPVIPTFSPGSLNYIPDIGPDGPCATNDITIDNISFNGTTVLSFTENSVNKNISKWYSPDVGSINPIWVGLDDSFQTAYFFFESTFTPGLFLLQFIYTCTCIWTVTINVANPFFDCPVRAQFLATGWKLLS